jgi:hypothetical protein
MTTGSIGDDLGATSAPEEEDRIVILLFWDEDELRDAALQRKHCRRAWADTGPISLRVPTNVRKIVQPSQFDSARSSMVSSSSFHSTTFPCP